MAPIPALRVLLIGISLLSHCFCAYASIDDGTVTKEHVVNTSAPDVAGPPLDIADFAAGADLTPVDLRAIGIDVADDPTVAAGKREGDLDLDVPLATFVQNSNLHEMGVQSKSAIRSVWRRWTDGRIPYTMSGRYGKYSRSVIARAMDEFHRRSCVRFVPRSDERDYVYIHPDDGCYSLVGRTGGRQPLSLDAGCIDTGTVMHELMHTVGFFHEQSRNDRDDWIDIDWANVLFEARDQFEKYSLRTIDHLGVQYDYNSLMHYGRYAFTRNGRPTIVARKAGARNMGQRDGFSTGDVERLKLLYGEQCDEDGDSAVGGGGAKPKPTAEVTGAQLRCEDDERYAFRCRLWSTRIFNYCQTLEEVRTVLCAKSCGACVEPDDSADGGGDAGGSGTDSGSTGGTGSTSTHVGTSRPTEVTGGGVTVSLCKDDNPGCGRWHGKGFCTQPNFAKYMRATCAKSCGFCGAPAGTTAEERPPPLLPDSIGSGGESASVSGGRCGDSADYEVVCKLAKIFNRCNPATASGAVKRHCRRSCAMC